MRFVLGGEVVDRPCLWPGFDAVHYIDQSMLPSETVMRTAATIGEQVTAIRTLAVRGAPAIGVFSALSLAFGIGKGSDPRSLQRELLSARPTAVDPRNDMAEVMDAFGSGGALGAMEMAVSIFERTKEQCRLIGENGSWIVPEGGRVMTHCNAGALASVDWGTALSPIRAVHRKGGRLFVWVSETRPLLQGSRLTAWELSQEGVQHSIIVDSASGYLMKEGQVDVVIVGADRIARNGDVVNKIGTYEKAVLAKENGVPFYVAHPYSTLDRGARSGDDIIIEERDTSEVLSVLGGSARSPGRSCSNPAFDVTPSRYVTGYVTPGGVLGRAALLELFG